MFLHRGHVLGIGGIDIKISAASIIAFAKRLAARVPAYEFSFTPDRSAIDFFLEFIKKQS